MTRLLSKKANCLENLPKENFFVIMKKEMRRRCVEEYEKSKDIIIPIVSNTFDKSTLLAYIPLKYNVCIVNLQKKKHNISLLKYRKKHDII